MPDGLILFAHGSRDPEWARPLERLRDRLQMRLPGRSVLLAYLELSAPSLPQAVATLAAQGTGRIRILPLFLGQGSHARRDLPQLAQAVRRTHPGLTIELLPPLGDQPELVEALAGAIAESLR